MHVKATADLYGVTRSRWTRLALIPAPDHSEVPSVMQRCAGAEAYHGVADEQTAKAMNVVDGVALRYSG